MASTYSTSLQLQLIGTGEQSGVWGTTTNTNWNLIEQAVAGVQSITMLNADYTLSVLNGVSDEARNMVLVVGGTNSAIRKIVAPLVNKVYVVSNNTSGGYAITIGGSSGTLATIPNGTSVLVYCDGVNFYGGITGVAGNLTVSGNIVSSGSITGSSFSGDGTGLTGTASSLSIGGTAATATNPAGGGSFITSLNIGSQSVSYASTAGSASTATSATTASSATTVTGTIGSSVTGTTQATNTRNTTIATTAFANPAASIGTNGYVTLPSGIIMQWGKLPSIPSQSTASVTYPIAFPNAVYNVTTQLTLTSPDTGGHNYPFHVVSPTTTGFSCDNRDTNANTGYYFAIGY
jgi:hypothetical protein